MFASMWDQCFLLCTRRCVLCGTSAPRSSGEFDSTWIPSEHMTIPKALKQIDPAYRCAHFGKWGEGMISTPEECGYDASDGQTGNHSCGTYEDYGYKTKRGLPPHLIDDKDAKLTHSLTERALGFMREQVRTRNPFYVQVSYYAVHNPIVCSQAKLIKYERKGKPDRTYPQAFAAMLDELDQSIGVLLDELERLEVADNTYVVYMGDNGGKPWRCEEQRPTSNYPLSGCKQYLMEGGIRVPFIVRGSSVRRGIQCNVPVVGYDLLPTFCDLAGGDTRLLPEYIDGGSLRKLFSDPAGGRVSRKFDGLVFHRRVWKFRSSAMRRGKHKIVLRLSPEGTVEKRELYDLSDSPVDNKRDISKHYPEITDQLQSEFMSYLKSVKARMPRAPRKKISYKGQLLK